MAGFLAYILPVDAGHPAHPIAPGGPPPGYWGGVAPPLPTHPIVIPPDAIGPGVPSHPIYLPPPAEPTHPIVIPPGGIGPGVPTHPIVLPPPAHPSHPIVIPPGSISPGVPTHPIVLPPLGIWGGPPLYPDQGLPGPQPGPEHPIVLPPGGEPIEPPSTLPPPAGHENDVVVMVYKPGQGWSGAAYDVAPDQGQPVPTPVG